MSRIAQTTIASPTRCRHLVLATLATMLLGLTVAGRPALASDLRSPDARDVAREEGPRVSSDLRSPDARELGRPQRRVSSPPASPSDSGFRWIYVAVGGLGLALLVGGATTRHVRRRVKHAPAVVGG